MPKSKPIFTTAQKISSLLLMIALLWLSVCTPYVYKLQQQLKAEKAAMADTDQASEEDGNPLSNTNEEKSESSPTSSIQEFLHEPLHIEHPSLEQVNEYGHFEQKPSIAFHPELLSPPPDL